jgi:hypothetical protein
MRREVHVRFGGRAEETDRPQGRHRASVRPLHRAPDPGGETRWGRPRSVALTGTVW